MADACKSASLQTRGWSNRHFPAGVMRAGLAVSNPRGEAGKAEVYRFRGSDMFCYMYMTTATLVPGMNTKRTTQRQRNVINTVQE